MTREDAATKARRLLAEGRITLRHIGDDLVRADVRGDTARIYAVAWSPAGWSCDCDAISRCSHIRSVQLVTLEPRPLDEGIKP